MQPTPSPAANRARRARNFRAAKLAMANAPAVPNPAHNAATLAFGFGFWRGQLEPLPLPACYHKARRYQLVAAGVLYVPHAGPLAPLP